MAIVLLDTSVASFLHPRKRESTYRAAYEPHLRGNLLAMSFQTVAELVRWAEQSKWGARQQASLGAFIQRFVVIPYDLELARTWARVMTQARHAGYRLNECARVRAHATSHCPAGSRQMLSGRRGIAHGDLESGDAWIAATAVHRRIPLVTHDKDFLRTPIPGLQVVCHAD